MRLFTVAGSLVLDEWGMIVGNVSGGTAMPLAKLKLVFFDERLTNSELDIFISDGKSARRIGSWLMARKTIPESETESPAT